MILEFGITSNNINTEKFSFDNEPDEDELLSNTKMTGGSGIWTSYLF